MPTRYIQNSLNAGELSPRLSARDDFDRYISGVAEMTNFVPLVQGGARTRPGLQWVARTRDNGMAYLIPFEFSTTQAYIIEVGHQYFRFYKDEGRIYDLSGTISNVVNNGTGGIRVTSAGHGLSTGNRVEITGVTGTVEANGEWVITVIDGNTFDLNGSSFTNAYTGGGAWNRPYELAHPYTLADLPALRWVQTADTLYLAHGSYALRKLTRTGHTNWTLTTVTFLDGPYRTLNTTSITMTPSVAAAGATGTLTASAAYFDPGMVGTYFRLFIGGIWGYVRVDAYNSPTSVNITVMTALGGTTATTTWREGAFSTYRGFPALVGFIEQRLVLAATKTDPQTLWFSTTGSYEDFTPTAPSGAINSDHSLMYRLGTDTGKVNVCRWLLGGRNLQVGTLGEEFSLEGGNVALAPTSPPVARATTSYGSAAVRAIRAGRTNLFVQRSGRKLRGLSFDFSGDTYVAPELSVFAEHFFRTASITRLAYQPEPDSLVWCILSNGDAATLAYDESQRLFGWARQRTAGAFMDVAVIPSADGSGDTAWFVVRRTVNGVTRYFVEFATYTQNLDAALAYDGTIRTATLTPSATSGSGVTCTASSPVFTPSHVGNELILLGYQVGGKAWYSRAVITAVLSATQVTVTITAAFPSTDPIPAGSWGIGKTRVTGLYHLIGETVHLVGDNAVYDPQIVGPDGSVTLRYGDTVGPAAVVIKAGLLITPNPKIRTLQPVYRDQFMVARSRAKHWAEVYVALENTLGLTIQGTQLQYRTPADPLDQGPPVFTGEKKVFTPGWSKEGTLVFEQELPLPATILAYYGDLEIGER